MGDNQRLTTEQMIKAHTSTSGLDRRKWLLTLKQIKDWPTAKVKH